MPYIKQDRREALAYVSRNGEEVPGTAGELNYLLTETCLEYCRAKGLNYATINDVLGALEGAKLEFYRRVAAPYENTKIEQNGDVY